MWVFVGSGKRLEPVEGGREERRLCQSCGRNAVFYEKRMTRTLSVYFVDLAAFSPKYVMVCGACSAGYAVDDAPSASFAETQRGTALGALTEAALRAQQAATDGTAGRMAQDLEDAATDALANASRWLRGRLKK